MEPNWIILGFIAIMIIIVMVYIFRENNKDRKRYEKDLKRPSNLFEDESEVNDTDKF